MLISCSTLPHVLLNTPLTVTLLSHGTAFLFLLWYVMPRSIFERLGTSRIFHHVRGKPDEVRNERLHALLDVRQQAPDGRRIR
ncbi:hypothetical protein ABIA95_005449 [Bradyrhizobium sp. LA8.1]